ncbi:hypothetical protein GW17_00033965, partial [Ensete ventricosum]
LISALSRDLLDEFLPLLTSLLLFLEIIAEFVRLLWFQVFTSWSYIMMYMQKYLVRDVVYVLK